MTNGVAKSYYSQQPKKSEGNEVKKDNLEKGKIKGEEDGDSGQNKECFVMDGRKKAFGYQHEDDQGQ